MLRSERKTRALTARFGARSSSADPKTSSYGMSSAGLVAPTAVIQASNAEWSPAHNWSHQKAATIRWRGTISLAGPSALFEAMLKYKSREQLSKPIEYARLRFKKPFSLGDAAWPSQLPPTTPESQVQQGTLLLQVGWHIRFSSIT